MAAVSFASPSPRAPADLPSKGCVVGAVAAMFVGADDGDVAGAEVAIVVVAGAGAVDVVVVGCALSSAQISAIKRIGTGQRRCMADNSTASTAARRLIQCLQRRSLHV